MIEIVFSDSAAGSLKQAQHYGSGIYYACSSVFIIHSNGRKPRNGSYGARNAKQTNENAMHKKMPYRWAGLPLTFWDFR